MSRHPLTRTLIRAGSAFARRIVAGRVPKLFDAAFYLRHNDDVRASGLDPYLHYILRGAAENRDPAADFDTAFVREQSGATRLDPVRHYLRVGAATGLDPNPNFSSAAYLSRYADVAPSGVNPLLHYRTDGRSEGRLSRPSAAKPVEIPALRSVLSRHLRRLPAKEDRPFAIALLRELTGGDGFVPVPRFCVLMKLTHAEIALLVNALGTMGAGEHAAITFEIGPDREADSVGAGGTAGSDARPKGDTLLAAFERCHVATIGDTIRIRYAELRLWDLRPHAPRVAEIFPAGMAEIQA